MIVLNESCRVSRADGSNTFEIATGAGAGCKTYYLTADSQPIMEEWVRVLQNVVQRNALKLLLSQEDHKPTVQVRIFKLFESKYSNGILIKYLIYSHTFHECVMSECFIFNFSTILITSEDQIVHSVLMVIEILFEELKIIVNF